MPSYLRSLILHITDGHAAGRGRRAQRASTYLGVDKDGEVWRSVDTARRAWSADGDTVDGNLGRIENRAVPRADLTTAPMDVCAPTSLFP